jgi:hypothetical protein
VFSDLFKGSRLSSVETKSKSENLTFTLIKRGQQTLDLFGEQCHCGNLKGRLCGTVFDDVTEFGVSIFSERLRKREWFRSEAQRLNQLVFWHLNFNTEFSKSRRSSIFQLKASLCFLDSGKRVSRVYWKTNRSTSVRNSTGDGLANPPRCVG